MFIRVCGKHLPFGLQSCEYMFSWWLVFIIPWKRKQLEIYFWKVSLRTYTKMRKPFQYYKDDL